MTLNMRVCVHVLVPKGPGGDVGATQSTFPSSNVGFYTRLTSRYEDKATILRDQLGTSHRLPQLGQQNTQTRLLSTQTHTHLFMWPLKTNSHKLLHNEAALFS